jgi:predicted aldo/keto reductase-like oxidoreductase
MSMDGPDKNRRKFLSQASLALASAGAVTLPRPWKAYVGKASVAGQGKEIIHRTLGRTGFRVPIVSMGVMNANNPEVVKQAYEAGVRLFDTAVAYQNGRNEQMIGDVFTRMGVRDQVYIQTKIRLPGGLAAGTIKDRILNDFAGSLKRLQTSYVDVLMMHQPSIDQMKNPEVLEALKEAKSQKTARFVGVSQHANQAATLDEAVNSGFYDVVVVGFNFTNSEDQTFLQAIKNAAARGVGVIAMKTQTGGRARNVGPLHQTAMLKWVLQHPEITTAIPGYTTFDQLNESFGIASNLEYTGEERTWLEDKNIRLAVGFCQQCGRCLPTCPKGVDVPTLMRTHMYAANYTNFEQARSTLDEIPEHAGLRNCSTCASCSARCAHQVTIRERIAELKLIYA